LATCPVRPVVLQTTPAGSCAGATSTTAAIPYASHRVTVQKINNTHLLSGGLLPGPPIGASLISIGRGIDNTVHAGGNHHGQWQRHRLAFAMDRQTGGD